MSKKTEAPTPEKSGAEKVLEEILPRFDKLSKEVAEVKRHLHPQEKKSEAPKEEVISSGEGNQSEAGNHAAIKLNNPRWNFCPWCDDDNTAKLPDLPADADARLRSRPVKCTNCGEKTVLDAKRCPGCGTKSDFDPDD